MKRAGEEPTCLNALITYPPVPVADPELVLILTVSNLEVIKELEIRVPSFFRDRFAWPRGCFSVLKFPWLPWWGCEGTSHEDGRLCAGLVICNSDGLTLAVHFERVA
jgi:hypothetical protein